MSSSSGPVCPLCGDFGRAAFSKEGYAHFRCGACRSLFIDPVPDPDALAEWYRAADAEKNSALCWGGSERHALTCWLRTLGTAERLAGKGPLLDVGCGAGQFLVFARQRGWTDLAGIEPSPAAARLAQTRSEATVHQTPLLDVALRDASYAVVTLWDVIEHLSEPRRTLRRVVQLLRPGGVVILGTPNVEGLTTRRFGRRALVVMPPEHLFVAARRGLQAVAVSEGLEVVRVEAIDVRIRDWLGPAPGTPVPSRSAAIDRYKAAYGRLTRSGFFGSAQRAANAVLNATGLGDQLVMIARKPASARASAS